MHGHYRLRTGSEIGSSQFGCIQELFQISLLCDGFEPSRVEVNGVLQILLSTGIGRALLETYQARLFSSVGILDLSVDNGLSETSWILDSSFCVRLYVFSRLLSHTKKTDTYHRGCKGRGRVNKLEEQESVSTLVIAKHQTPARDAIADVESQRE